MSYQVLARKWRPRNFQQVVGQEHVLRALINALDNERLHHAYLFTGTRGVGKTTLGRILAKSLNCDTGITSTPCGQCAACQEIDQGRFVDLLEVDAASRTKVDDTRDLLENVQYAPSRGRFKIYLIDEVHMLSDHSFNALLKTLEEPPPHVKFILATTDPQKIPITVLSRCLKFSLKNLMPDQISTYLATVLAEEAVPFEEEALKLVSEAAEGSMRDSLSLMDQIIAFGGGEVKAVEVREMLGSLRRDDVAPLLAALADGNAEQLLAEVQQLAQYGVDFTVVLDEMMALLHELAVDQVLSVESQSESSAALAQKLSPADVQLYYQIAVNGRADLSRVSNPRNAFEMLMLRMLAFQPASFTAKSSPSAATPRRPASRAVAAPQAAYETTAKAVASSQQPVSPAPQSGNPAAATIETPVVAVDGGDWGETVNQLPISGMVRQLALNCSLSRREGNIFHLSLAKSNSQLASRNLVERLQAAMRKQFGDTTVIHIDMADAGTAAAAVETPAQQSAREYSERLEHATGELQQNPSVQALKQTFDAQLDEQNIQLLNKQKQ